MSFDLFLQCFENGNPLPADRSAIREVLRRHTDAKSDPFGFYVIAFADGSGVEFSAKGLDSEGDFFGCAFHLRKLSEAVASLVYEIATAGNMVVLNPQGDGSDERPVTIIIANSQRDHLPEGLEKNPRLAESVASFAEAIGADMSRWQECRNRIVTQRTSA